ncbi:MAG: hypothetical protein RJR37_09590 [Peptococcaceae bacterium MAG4]|nr:hypothetical protein [Peptococcaceae bacterium MAG4]
MASHPKHVGSRSGKKGKVESNVKYLKKSFYYGREFKNLEDLNQSCRCGLRKWPSQSDGTTGEIPEERLIEERKYLKPLPAESKPLYPYTKPVKPAKQPLSP